MMASLRQGGRILSQSAQSSTKLPLFSSQLQGVSLPSLLGCEILRYVLERDEAGYPIHSKSENVCGTAFSVKKKIAEKVRKSGRHFWANWGNFGPFCQQLFQCLTADVILAKFSQPHWLVSISPFYI